MGFWGRDDLPRVWEPVHDVCGQVSGFPQLRNVLLRNGGDHSLASHSRHVWNGFAEKMRIWALELERARMGVITHKYMGLQQFLRVEYSTQIY